MIDELDRRQIEDILGGTKGRDPFPTYEDADRWRAILRNPMLKAIVQQRKDRPEDYLREPLTLIPASLYMSYQRTGDRLPHDGLVSARRTRLSALVMGECMERRGRYVGRIMDHIWAICEESSWVIPAHSRSLLPAYRDISWVDLVSAGTAQVLGETLRILGRRLDEEEPMIRERILHELQRRIWRPYLEPKDLAWLFSSEGRPVNNWNAVCNCGIVGSAILALEDKGMLARMIETCLRSLNNYLRSFDPQGGSAEGASYWRYGVSNYAWLSYLLEMRTDGRISPLSAPEMRNIALFPQRVTLTGQRVVNFSDCSQQVHFTPSLMFYLGKRLGMPQVTAFAQHEYDIEPKGDGRYTLRDLVWMPEKPSPAEWEPDAHVFLQGQQWMISRARARANASDQNCLILAAKGGHNGESHNHNDLGNFIVHSGGEPLIVDLGSGTYSKDYFGPKRYDLLVNSSWGHNVPLVNGLQQSPGPEYRAEVLRHEGDGTKDLLELELAGAYPPEARLQSLRRLFVLERGEKPWIGVEDRIILEETFGRCKLPLYTFGRIRKSRGKLRIAGERTAIIVEYGPDGIDPAIERVKLDDSKIPGPIRRAIFDVPIEGNSGSLYLRISSIAH